MSMTQETVRARTRPRPPSKRPLQQLANLAIGSALGLLAFWMCSWIGEPVAPSHGFLPVFVIGGALVDWLLRWDPHNAR